MWVLMGSHWQQYKNHIFFSKRKKSQQNRNEKSNHTGVFFFFLLLNCVGWQFEENPTGPSGLNRRFDLQVVVWGCIIQQQVVTHAKVRNTFTHTALYSRECPWTLITHVENNKKLTSDLLLGLSLDWILIRGLRFAFIKFCCLLWY